MHLTILICHVSVDCWKDSSGMPFGSVVTPFLMPSKRFSLMIPFWAGRNKKKATCSKSREIGRLFQYSDISHGPGTAECIVVINRALSKVYAAGYLCRLADWLPGPVVRTYSGRCHTHRRTGSIFMTFHFDWLIFFDFSSTWKIFTDRSDT